MDFYFVVLSSRMSDEDSDKEGEKKWKNRLSHFERTYYSQSIRLQIRIAVLEKFHRFSFGHRFIRFMGFFFLNCAQLHTANAIRRGET